MRRLVVFACAFLLPAVMCEGMEVKIVADGEPMAVVVTAEEPTPVAQYAAEELVYHVETATGMKLQIVTENAIPGEPAGRIYIGNCEAARAAGIEPAKLPAEACVLKTTDQGLFIAGEDGDGDPLSTYTHAGTLWGVYELLERVLQVRWLWPGELGVYVPKTRTVKIGELDETISPWLLQRNLRHTMRPARGTEYAFSPEAEKKYAHNQAVFLRRHRMGQSMRLRYGHAFHGWWEKYGREHPDWFQLRGGRGPVRRGDKTSMCVSNPEFHQKIVELWREAREKDPGKFININSCENDIAGWCGCETCRAWDGPQPKDVPSRFGPPSVWERYARLRVVSDRYARFYLSVQQLAAKTDPEALVVGYAYVNYYPAPQTDIRLNENIMIGLCPGFSLNFPRTPEEQEWVTQQYMGWGKTGARLLLRPNYFLQGYCMPHIFAHQFADEFKSTAPRLAATDFDSLTGQWSTQGPNLYLLVRLHLRPETSTDGLLSEYYSAFGPAGKHVKAYFDYWEDHTTRKVPPGVTRTAYANAAGRLFPQPCFEPAEKLLGDAAAAAAGDPEFAARVEWLEKGLKHAKLCARTAGLLSGEDQDASPVAAERAREELLAFRREVENDGIANMNYCAQREGSWPRLYKGEALRPVAEAVEKLEGAPGIPVRGVRTCVALLKTGERFAAQLSCELLTIKGKKKESSTPAVWRAFGPDDKLIAKGFVSPGEEARIDLPVTQDGLHLLSIQSGDITRVTLLNDHAALAGRSIGLFGKGSPMFFFVPEGVEKFNLTLGDQPKWPVRATLFSPDGKEVDVDEARGTYSSKLEVTVPEGQSGRAWSVQVGPAGRRFENYTLTLGEELPAYWSHAADRLVVPRKRN